MIQTSNFGTDAVGVLQHFCLIFRKPKLRYPVNWTGSFGLVTIWTSVMLFPYVATVVMLFPYVATAHRCCSLCHANILTVFLNTF
jgi:hypothetical protein